MQAKYRNDYQAPDFQITQVDLNFHLDAQSTRVESQLNIQRQGQHQRPLRLDGEHLKLVSVALNEEVLPDSHYQLDEQSLVIANVPNEFVLTVVTEINPAANQALEGLYLSEGTFCTQCEAEGFRRITYYLDRPDVLARFKTTIHANTEQFPFLLSNGNCVDKGRTKDGKHYATWDDPHPKPCYLFALVAGDFDVLDDTFTTRSGRDVKLQLFVDKGNLDKADHAMTSLVNSMRWDEERFGLEYDLDIYMIVAVDFFNMGAMENKGLNVFNSKYVLANPKTATDQDFLNVESVIGHEYFHNWTGNRITCRDWFQLSLKEGLTVFRDQEFSADLGSRAVNRIQDVKIIRSHQFNEDASPMAHPIRPDKVVEMNNFYTVTVYNKGAEVIRMLHTLLGEDGFQNGMRRYIERHDGTAAACEDFVAAMETANQRDFQQFRRWYSQAGTPVLSITSNYDEALGQATLKVSQFTPATPGQKNKQPLHLPLVVSAYDATGKSIALRSSESQTLNRTTTGGYVLELTEVKQTWHFDGLADEPVWSLLENFSAPVKLDYERPANELHLLSRVAVDPVSRWDALQQLFRQVIEKAVSEKTKVELDEALVATLKAVLASDIDPALKALALQTPSFDECAEDYSAVPVTELSAACQSLEGAVGFALADDCVKLYDQLNDSDDSLSSEAIATRALQNRCLHMLAAGVPERALDLVKAQFSAATSMTLQLGALQAAVWWRLPCADELLEQFERQWHQEPLVMDKWLATQAATPTEATVLRVEQLANHSAFSISNPNRVYALFATFSRNTVALTAEDGRGVDLLSDVITRLNASNPQVASRLLSPLTQWRRYHGERSEIMKNRLERLQQLPDLARDLAEKIEQSLTTES